MKSLLSLLIAVQFAAVAALAQTPGTTSSSAGSGGDDQAILLKFEDEWANATLKKDADAITRIEADGYIFTHPDGTMTTKADDLRMLKSEQTRYETYKLSDMKVHLYGDTAVVTGRAVLKGMEEGKDVSGEYQWTDTLIKRNGKWQSVASHASHVDAKK